jgi:uncharacterized protein (TIGR03089 family)
VGTCVSTWRRSVRLNYTRVIPRRQARGVLCGLPAPDRTIHEAPRVARVDVLTVLTGADPTTPRLTWYGEEGERIELSGRVLANWVTKAANLLTDECGTGVGDRLLLDLPAHWRLLVWACAGRALGAEVEVEVAEAGDAAADSDADVVVTHRPDAWLGAREVIATPLPALARAWPTPLPAGVVDGAAELMGQPDVATFAVARAEVGAERGDGQRLLLPAEDPRALVARAWRCWAAGGSVVLVTPRPAPEIAAIGEQEHALPGDLTER